MIHEANTDAARHEVLDFFLAAFDDIDPNAVPMTVHDDLYAPLVVQFRDENSRAAAGRRTHLLRTGRCRVRRDE